MHIECYTVEQQISLQTLKSNSRQVYDENASILIPSYINNTSIH